MKVIDLLNKIANNEEVPKRIKYNDTIYTFCNGHYTWVDDLDYGTYDLAAEGNLNDEVEIIEEYKEIKPISTIYSGKWYSDYINTYIEEEEKYSVYDELLMNKVNEIIDEIKKLKGVK